MIGACRTSAKRPGCRPARGSSRRSKCRPKRTRRSRPANRTSGRPTPRPPRTWPRRRTETIFGAAPRTAGNGRDLYRTCSSWNVSVHRTTHLVRRTVERLVQRFHFPDFHACKPKKSKNRPENRVLGLVEPIFSIFRPFSAVIFIFRGIARTFSRIFPL